MRRGLNYIGLRILGSGYSEKFGPSLFYFFRFATCANPRGGWFEYLPRVGFK